MRTLLAALSLVWVFACPLLAAEPPRVGVFDIDASPPIGSPLAYDPCKEVQESLRCRGVVLVGAGEPIVLCAVDWIGIANSSHREFRETLAKGAGTTAGRVAVHTLHQHDAPWCDADSDAICQKHELAYRPFDIPFAREVMRRAGEAAAKAVKEAKPVTHLGLGMAKVERVASNRRILGPEGKVIHVRYTATKDPAIREFPEGVVDPVLRIVSLWDGEKPLVALTYYATHPQSYYRTGKANPDFPGMARNARQTATGVPHVHFNGAGGNIGAGKYNDGAPENRQVLADRVAAGMKEAWDATKRSPLAAADVRWQTEAVSLPPTVELDEKTLIATIDNKELMPLARFTAANKLAWLNRCKAGEKIDLACLTLGDARVLHMPGELFVEYQLEAQRLAPKNFVCMAAYGDYGTAYIGTTIAYPQGGYETGPNASFVAPEVEGVLTPAIGRLLGANPESIRPLR